MKNATLGLFAVLAVGLGAIYGFVRIRAEMSLGRSAELAPSMIEKHQVTPQMLASSEANEGKIAPKFSAPASDGQTYELAPLIANGPLVVVFIKQGCPCSNEAEPFFRRLHEALGTEVGFLGVIDGNPSVALSWVNKYQTPYPILADPDLVIVKGYGAENSAYVALVNMEGNIDRLWPGYSAGMLNELIERVGSLTGRALKPVDVSGAPNELYSGCPYF